MWLGRPKMHPHWVLYVLRIRLYWPNDYNMYAGSPPSPCILSLCLHMINLIHMIQYDALKYALGLVIHFLLGQSSDRKYSCVPHETSPNGTFSALLALCEGNSLVTGEFPAQRPVTRSFDAFFICAWINSWVNNREAGDLRRHNAYYNVNVM